MVWLCGCVPMPTGVPTTKVKVVELDVVPSLTVTVISVVLAWPATGVIVMVRLPPLPPNTMFALGTIVVFDAVPDSVRLPAGVSTSSIVTGIGAVGVASFVAWLAIGAIVGGSLTELTVSKNDVDVGVVPSLTVTVIVVVPNWLAAGVMTRFRLAPLPPRAMFAFGTSVVFDELAVTVSAAAAVSTSPTVKAMAPVGVSSFVV